MKNVIYATLFAVTLVVPALAEDVPPLAPPGAELGAASRPTSPPTSAMSGTAPMASPLPTPVDPRDKEIADLNAKLKAMTDNALLVQKLIDALQAQRNDAADKAAVAAAKCPAQNQAVLPSPSR